MGNKKNIIIGTIVILSIVLLVGTIIFKNTKKEEKEEYQEDFLIPNVPNVEIDKNQVSYNESATVKELKENSGVTGSDEIYEVKTEYDGRRFLEVKHSIQYEVALNHILDKGLEKDIVLYKNGIWLAKNSWQEFLKLLHENAKCKYEIGHDGYLQVLEENTKNKIDEVIIKTINSEKKVVVEISGEMAIIDEVTGEKQIYPFGKMDRYQTYEYIRYKNDCVIILTKNEERKLQNSEIINAFISILEN